MVFRLLMKSGCGITKIGQKYDDFPPPMLAKLPVFGSNNIIGQQFKLSRNEYPVYKTLPSVTFRPVDPPIELSGGYSWPGAAGPVHSVIPALA